MADSALRLPAGPGETARSSAQLLWQGGPRCEQRMGKGQGVNKPLLPPLPQGGTPPA